MMRERIYVSSADTIAMHENNLITLTTASGEVFEALEPRRLFPVSRSDTYISLLDKDGVEIGIIKSLSDLNQDSMEAIKYSLDDYYLVPHILKILHTEEKYGTLRWTVQTDRGVKSFDIRNRSHDIRVYKDGKIRIRDSDDNRYTIDNYHNLDSASKSRLIADM